VYLLVDTFYLTNQIQMELNNLKRDHVYYSVDQQPDVCAALIAGGYWAKFFPMKWAKSNQEVEGLNFGSENLAKEMLRDAIFGHRVSVTVQSWGDVPAAIGLIRERQREFKRKVGR
jgi:hypothetical protein